MKIYTMKSNCTKCDKIENMSLNIEMDKVRGGRYKEQSIDAFPKCLKFEPIKIFRKPLWRLLTNLTVQ